MPAIFHSKKVGKMVVPPSSSWKWTEDMQKIEEASKKLQEPYDKIEELVERLDGLNRLLREVDQQLSPAMELAIKFPTEALIANELLMNDDINVKLSLGCCMCEVARLTAPEPPYKDSVMREFCNILITILGSLSFVTGDAYTKAASVLYNVARCQLFMAMWDCDDSFIVKMFRVFLNLRGTNHLNSVIDNMKHILTLTLKEDEADVPSELLTIVLHSLKKENMNVYPVSYKLAETVLQDCASELKHSLQTVLSDGDLKTYSEIVARVLSVAEKPLEVDGNGEHMRSTSVASEGNMNDARHLIRTDDTLDNGVPVETSLCLESMQQQVVELNYASEKRDGKADHGLNSESLASKNNEEPSKDTQEPISPQVIQDELVSEQVSAIRKPSLTEESSKNDRSINMLRACDKTLQDAVDTSCSDGKKSDPSNIVFEESKSKEVSASMRLQEPGLTTPDVTSLVRESLDSQTLSTSVKRGRRPNSLLKPEEGYDDSWMYGGTGSLDVPRRRRNKRKEIDGASAGLFFKKIFSASPVEVERPQEAQDQSISNKIRSKKGKPRKANEILNRNGNLQVSKMSTAEAIQSASEIEDCMGSDHKTEEKRNGSEESPQIRDGSTSDHTGKKSLLKRLASLETPEAPSEFDKVINAIKAKTKKKRTRPKEEVSELTETMKNNDDRLVGHRIKVFWPLDETFYIGSVISFDVLTKKHKVLYDDGDEEELDLSSEQWALGDDIPSDNLLEQGKVADAVMLPDTSKNAAGFSEPLTKKHKVLDDVSGGPASTSKGQRRKVLKNIATSKKVKSPLDVDGEHATTSTGQMQKKVRKRRSKREILEDLEREQKSNFNGQMSKVPKNRSKLDQEQAVEIKKPATINSPSSKVQGKSRSKSSKEKLQKSPVIPSSSCSLLVGAGSSETVNVHGYQVKCSTAPILSAIISKYGDIAANCLYKSPSIRTSMLEVVCKVVQRLKHPVLTTSDIQSMLSEVSDAENAKINVSWLLKYLEEIANEEKAAKKDSDIRMSTSLTVGAAEMEFKLRQAELEAVQTKHKEAEKRFEVLKHVLGRIDASILESVAKENSWHRRLDELLCSK